MASTETIKDTEKDELKKLTYTVTNSVDKISNQQLINIGSYYNVLGTSSSYISITFHYYDKSNNLINKTFDSTKYPYFKELSINDNGFKSFTLKMFDKDFGASQGYDPFGKTAGEESLEYYIKSAIGGLNNYTESDSSSSSNSNIGTETDLTAIIDTNRNIEANISIKYGYTDVDEFSNLTAEERKNLNEKYNEQYAKISGSDYSSDGRTGRWWSVKKPKIENKLTIDDSNRTIKLHTDTNVDLSYWARLNSIDQSTVESYTSDYVITGFKTNINNYGLEYEIKGVEVKNYSMLKYKFVQRYAEFDGTPRNVFRRMSRAINNINNGNKFRIIWLNQKDQDGNDIGAENIYQEVDSENVKKIISSGTDSDIYWTKLINYMKTNSLSGNLESELNVNNPKDILDSLDDRMKFLTCLFLSKAKKNNLRIELKPILSIPSQILIFAIGRLKTDTEIRKKILKQLLELAGTTEDYLYNKYNFSDFDSAYGNYASNGFEINNGFKLPIKEIGYYNSGITVIINQSNYVDYSYLITSSLDINLLLNSIYKSKYLKNGKMDVSVYSSDVEKNFSVTFDNIDYLLKDKEIKNYDYSTDGTYTIEKNESSYQNLKSGLNYFNETKLRQKEQFLVAAKIPISENTIPVNSEEWVKYPESDENEEYIKTLEQAELTGNSDLLKDDTYIKKIQVSLGDEDSWYNFRTRAGDNTDRKNTYKSFSSLFDEFCAACPPLKKTEDSNVKDVQVIDAQTGNTTILENQNKTSYPMTWEILGQTDDGVKIIAFHYRKPLYIGKIRDYAWGPGYNGATCVSNINVENKNEFAVLSAYSTFEQSGKEGYYSRNANVANVSVQSSELSGTILCNDILNDYVKNNAFNTAYGGAMYSGSLTVMGDPFFSFEENVQPYMYPIHISIYYPNNEYNWNAKNRNNSPSSLSVFSGYYVVTSITHNINTNGYNTVLEISSYPGIVNQIFRKKEQSTAVKKAEPNNISS